MGSIHKVRRWRSAISLPLCMVILVLEATKFVGALIWIAAIITLFLVPAASIPLFFVAVLVSAYTWRKTREKRHAELVSAASHSGQQQSAKKPVPPSERLQKLSRLKEQGVITEEEYERKRQEIVDQL